MPLQMKSGVLIDYRLRLYGIPCIGKAKSVSGSRLIVLLTGKFGDLIEFGYTNTRSLNLMAEPWWRTQSNMPRRNSRPKTISRSRSQEDFRL